MWDLSCKKGLSINVIWTNNQCQDQPGHLCLNCLPGPSLSIVECTAEQRSWSDYTAAHADLGLHRWHNYVLQPTLARDSLKVISSKCMATSFCTFQSYNDVWFADTFVVFISTVLTLNIWTDKLLRSSLIRVYTVCHFTKHFKRQQYK